ncbi:MAG: helix-turn-helix domain-containing protein [Phycisphaerae bacterium]|nr:helix-turn-helix domain-containing protein [Phycisphaerae bacterium]
MSLGKTIRQRRRQQGLTLDEVAAKTGFSKPYLSTIETGKVNNPPSDNLLRRLEKLLKFAPSELRRLAHMERMPADIRRDYEKVSAENVRYKEIIQNIMHRNIKVTNVGQVLAEHHLDVDQKPSSKRDTRWIPVINKVAAGYPADFDDLGYPAGFADDYILCPDIHDPNAFAVRVFGDSMEPKFSAGDIVVFSPSVEAQSGDDCFVRFKSPHETTFKRVFFEKDGRVRLQPRNEQYPPSVVSGKRINGIYRAAIHFRTL